MTGGLQHGAEAQDGSLMRSTSTGGGAFSGGRRTVAPAGRSGVDVGTGRHVFWLQQRLRVGVQFFRGKMSMNSILSVEGGFACNRVGPAGVNGRRVYIYLVVWMLQVPNFVACRCSGSVSVPVLFSVSAFRFSQTNGSPESSSGSTL
mmetsp:Transcript_34509/g.103173  ORF Transcript_34509/g.103173 Transcript_34509/m.103173 type:complete len:147 (+) Transcript_34509:312-752(+)